MKKQKIKETNKQTKSKAKAKTSTKKKYEIQFNYLNLQPAFLYFNIFNKEIWNCLPLNVNDFYAITMNS